MPSKLVKRYRRKKRRNPDSDSGGSSSSLAIGEIGEYVLPGFAGFAVARFTTRVAATQIAKRKPAWAKHAGGIAALAAFFSAWLLVHRVKQLRKYHLPLVIGAGLAALQSIIQLYVPRLGWMVADASPDLAAADQVQQMSAGQRAAAALPAGLTAVDDNPADYVYNDSYDPGRLDHAQQQADSTGTAADSLSDIDFEEQQMGSY